MTMPEFRTHLKKYFDQVDNGEQVIITRLGKAYELRKLG